MLSRHTRISNFVEISGLVGFLSEVLEVVVFTLLVAQVPLLLSRIGDTATHCRRQALRGAQGVVVS